jgi:dolichol kinase
MRAEIERKLLHIALSALMLAPYLLSSPLKYDPVKAYGLIIAASAWLYAVRAKGIPRELTQAAKRVRIEGMDKLASQFAMSIERLERDYERRAGWIGLLTGVVGIGSSYMIFKDCFVAGVLAMIFVDGISAIAGISIGKRRVPMSKGTLEGTLAGFLSYFVVMAFMMDPVRSAVIATITSFTELYGIEDNISVPLVSSFLFLILR